MDQNKFIQNPHLNGEDFYWQGNQTGILLLHGFTATTAEVRLLAEKLHQAGFTTAAPLLPGHGTHPDDLNQTKWQMWLEKVKTAFEELSRNCTHMYIIGESMGALLALQLAAQHPEIDGLVLFAPALKIKKLWVAHFLAPFKDYLEKSGKDDGLPWKGYNVYPLKAALEMLKLQKDTRKHLAKIKQPTIVFTGEYDQTIAPDSAEIILNGIKSDDKRRIHMEKSTHCILLDQELDQVYQFVMDFIASQN